MHKYMYLGHSIVTYQTYGEKLSQRNGSKRNRGQDAAKDKSQLSFGSSENLLTSLNMSSSSEAARHK